MKQVNPLLNCVVDERFTDALKEAAQADELIASGKHTEQVLEEKWPFLGVPISTKDCIAVKDMKHTSGLYARRDNRSKEDADAIALMRAAGAIPFALTNVSELCMWWESSNKVHGRTRNPYDTNRIVGGSSGGEGTIQGACASPFGLGSDIGGSIRMPAFFNGVFGHKPSMNIVSNTGQFPIPFCDEQNSFLGIGPMCRYAVDLKPVLKIIAGDKARLLRLDEPVDLDNIRYFYQVGDGGGLLVSPMDADQTEAMNKVVKHLDNTAVHKPKKLDIEEFKQSTAIWFANMRDNSGKGFAHQMANMDGNIDCWTELLKCFVGMSKHTFVGIVTSIVDSKSIKYGGSKHRYLVEKRNKLRAQIEKLLGEDGVLLYPTHPTVAPYHNEPLTRSINFSYTAIFNCLGFPSTAVPLGLGAKEGLPTGVQVVANFNQDRLCLAVAAKLERAFGGWVPPRINA